MTQPIKTRRKNAFNIFREAKALGSFDEFPLLRPEVDPQLHLSRNSVDQPFHVVCEKDMVIAQINGAARVVFASGAVRYFDLGPGDYVYVPAGHLHRVLTKEPGEQVRYKPREPGVEGIVWTCESCGNEIDRHSWQANAAGSPVPCQGQWQLASERHNAEPQRRHCTACGTDNPPVDLTAFRWAAVVDAISLPD